MRLLITGGVSFHWVGCWPPRDPQHGSVRLESMP
jgi:hypothetical protein